MTKEERWNKERESWKETYDKFFYAFGVDSSSWDMLYKHWSFLSLKTPSVRKRIYAQYLVWDELIPILKEYDIAYYCGIDVFLAEWKSEVYGHLDNVFDYYKKNNND